MPPTPIEETDSHDDAEQQNEALADLLKVDWANYNVVKIERIERVGGSSGVKGWRLHYE